MWVFLAILAVPLIEIGLFVQLGGAIGLWATLAWVVATAALGIIVLKGVAMMGPISLSRDMRELNEPSSPLAHRVMLVMAGGLLLVPGFLTDALGLLLLVPPVRQAVIRAVGRRIRATQSMAAHVTVIDGEWTDVEDDNQPRPPSRH